jgi:prevent-host-death family protein
MTSSSVQVGAFEAKTKLGELLERVRRGENFTITKRDQPVARLVGYEVDGAERRQEATAALRTLRARYSLGEIDARELRNEGRA